MEIDSTDANAAVLPEVQVYISILVMMFLLDAKQVQKV
jgi:hypothetical protein